MQYLISVIDDMTNSGTAEEMKAVDDFNDQLRLNGHWIFAGGLDSPAKANVLDNRDGAGLSTDGPLFLANESGEHFSGFWVIDAPNLEIALTLAAEGSKSCNRKVELRPLLG